jgi:hypothetical protein
LIGNGWGWALKRLDTLIKRMVALGKSVAIYIEVFEDHI